MTPASRATAAVSRLRGGIERTDQALLALLVRRMKFARQVGQAKHRAGLPVLDPAREAKVVRQAAERARSLGMPPEAVRTIFWSIIVMCRGEQLQLPAPGVRRPPATRNMRRKTGEAKPAGRSPARPGTVAG